MLTKGDSSSVGSHSDTSSHWESFVNIKNPSQYTGPTPSMSAEVGAQHLGFPHTSSALGSLLQCSHNSNTALDPDWSRSIQDVKQCFSRDSGMAFSHSDPGFRLDSKKHYRSLKVMLF